MSAGHEPPLTPARPFPESLCHRCGAPPRYVTSDRGSVFVYCPVLRLYPPQPVLTCAAFVPSGEADGEA